MTAAEVGTAAMALPGVTHVVQWGESDVYKVGGKVFAVCGLKGGLSFKVSPIGFVVLTEDEDERVGTDGLSGVSCMFCYLLSE